MLRFRSRTLAASCAMIMGCMLANAQGTSPQTFEITPQNLRSALTEFARQSGTEILYSPDIVSGKRSPGVRGRLDPISALSRLLSDSGLTFTTTPQGAILLQPATQSAAKMQTIALVQGSVGPSTETASPPPASSDDSTNTAQTVRLEEVIVTGSHIRGAQDVTAPSLTITREDIDAGGYTTIQDLFRELPQNFAEFTPSAAYGHGVSRAAAQNTTDRASGIDLRGLGTQSTLVLLNGKRRAGSAAGRAVDISAIPVSVIERVEVVTGGRSATYGSDAVGGVVNFITRKSLDGMESGASYGLSDAGGEYFGLNHSAGIEAERGGLVVAYDYRHEQPLKALDTGHATSSWLPYGYRVSRLDLQPRADRHSGFIAGQYSFSDRFEFYADGLFSRKETESVGVQLYSGAESDSVSRSAFEADDYSLSAGVRAGVGGDWILDIAGTYALVDTLANDAANMDYGFFAAAYEYALTTEVATTTGSMVADGQLFTSNLMSARAAVGVEHREEELKYRVASTGVTQAIGGERRVDAVFAELLLDLLPDAGIGSLQVTLAGRYDDYSDFGSSFTPQAGISWQPARDWRVRGAYSSAFRAPAFFEYVGSANTGRLLSVSDPAIGDDLRTVLVWGGSNPAIRPEEADTWSVGLDFSPEYLPGLQLSISYYDVEYTGRVDSPYFGGVEEELILQREARYPGLIDRKPTEQRIATILESLEGRPVFNESGTAWDPATQSLLEAIPDLAVFDRRIANLARENVSGLDLSGSFAMNTSLGRVTTSVNAAYTLHHTRNITATSPAIEMLDEPGKPVNLRARASFGWAKDALAANLHVNYVDEYRNPYRTPTGRISSWTTADLTLRYSPQAVDARWWSGLDASFSISNMFDRDPPTFRDDPVNGLLYDRPMRMRGADSFRCNCASAGENINKECVHMMMASRVSRGSKLLAAVALMVGALSGVEASEDRPDSVMPQVTVKDIVEFTRLARPQERRKIDASPVFDVSPDGRHLLLVVRRGDVALNKNIFTLLHYRMDAIRGYLAGPENAVLPQPRQLLQWASSSLHVFEEAIRDLRWLPDSRRITFLGEENDAPTQVYEMDIESGHYTQLTRHPQPVLAYHYRPDSGKTIYVVRHNQTLKEWNPSSHIAGVNAVFQSLLPHDPTHFPLKFQFAVTDAAAAQQWRSIGDAFEADNVPILRVSPNARMAVSFEPITDIEEVQRWADQYPILMQGTAARALKMKEERSDYFARRYSGGLGRFALYDLSSGKRTFIDAPGGGFVAGHGGSIDAHWLSDTKVVLANIFIPRGAKLVGAIRRNERELPVVAEYDLESSAWRIIEHLYPAYLKLNFDKMLASTVLRDDAVLEVRTAQEVRAYKRGAQGWQRVTARSAASKASQALQFSIEQSLNSRPDVYVADPLTGRKKRLTNLNPRFDQLELASAQPFTWKDRHGQEFQSQIILPVGYLAGRRYPLFVQTYSFDPSEFVLDGAGGTTSAAAVRVMSARGMLVLMLPVLRDGTGGHDEFLGYRELLRDAVDALDAQGLIDPTRIGISGFSGMGNIVRDLITFSDVPIASATIADSWNSSLFGYLVYNFGFGVYGSVLANEAMMGAKPWGEDLQTWVERDPMLRTDRIDAALRIEHYGSYVPPHWDAYVLLRRQHKPVELVWFPPPTIHQLRRPDQRMDSLQGNVDWHSFWLKGEEDPDLSKKDQYERWREMREMRETARRSRGEQTSARLPSS